MMIAYYVDGKRKEVVEWEKMQICTHKQRSEANRE